MKYDLICDERNDCKTVMLDGKWGLTDLSYNELTPIQFGSKPCRIEQKYFKCIKEGKNGIFDFLGKEVIPVAYDNIIHLKDEVFYAVTNMCNKIIDLKNDFEIELLKGTSILGMVEDYLIASCNGLMGIMDRKGELVVPAECSNITTQNNYAILYYADKKIAVFNLKTNTIIIKGEFIEVGVLSEEIISAKNKKKKWGFYDKTGKEIIPFEYDSWTYFKNIDLLIVSQKNNKWLLNTKGEQIIPACYEEIDQLTNNIFVVTKNGKKGIVYACGKQIAPCKYDIIKSYIHEEYLKVEVGDKKGLLDLEGNVIIPTVYSEIEYLSSKYAIVRLDYFKRGLYNLQTGKMVCDVRYRSIGSFSEGYAVVENLDGKYGYIDEQGNEVIKCKHYSAGSFRNGYAQVSSAYHKKGYINREGQEVTKLIYDELGPINNNGEVKVRYVDEDYNTITGIIYISDKK